MKKILVTVMMVFAGISLTNASNLSEYRVFYKLTDSSTFNSLVRYLDASEEQADQLNYIFNITERKLNQASRRASETAAEKAVMFNLGNAKSILSREQYRKYLIVINVSRHNNYDNLAENK